jgi:hypothetical protein
MKRVILTAAIGCCLAGAMAQSTGKPSYEKNKQSNTKPAKRPSWTDRSNNPVFRTDSITKEGVTFIVIVQDSLFSTVTQQKVTDAFFTVYPQEVKRFNPASAKKVVFIVDPTYDGVAATNNAVIRCSPKWLAEHPEDVDLVTHEAMHIVQDYHKGNTPWWLTEGIADYVRYKYGVNNEKGEWRLPSYATNQHYTNSYRVTARFLVWVEENVDSKIVDEMNKAAFTGTYKEDLWRQYTGKSVDDLWLQYARAEQVAN